ncbi:CoA transferase [Paracrocinitomix mangrovi]|uniref:CaiB/BaiF CoA transferase family protein n=1 Tax=Paracrocinitomix mangrovi TaxID=2862509 RepID=UPI001C8D067F|nr:CaiB/BaiF CoA-transferase family protein [Paracrocinitomix mangrovi]UKN01506.1 CoA transferase [Paracrocinitomix mangrovi]
MTQSVISKLKVLELASVLAGPAVGMFFAERGAKVIKVENKKTHGDVTRGWKLKTEDTSAPLSAYYCSINWHKEPIHLDLLDDTDRVKLHQLIEEADIVVSNFKPGDADKFGVDFESLKKINPKIILGEITGFGSKNKRVAYDLVLQAETGFMFMNGNESSGPIKIPLAIIDILAAHQMKEGLLDALLNFQHDPKAYHVEVSLYDTAIASLSNQATNYLMANQIPQAMGSLHPNIAPYGEIFTTRDNKLVTLAVGSDKQFATLCEFIGLEINPHFEHNKDRVTNRKELDPILAEKMKLFNADELVNGLIQRNVPIAQIKNLKEVFELQTAKDLVLEEEMEGMHTRRVKSSVYIISN